MELATDQWLHNKYLGLGQLSLRPQTPVLCHPDLLLFGCAYQNHDVSGSGFKILSTIIPHHLFCILNVIRTKVLTHSLFEGHIITPHSVCLNEGKDSIDQQGPRKL